MRPPCTRAASLSMPPPDFRLPRSRHTPEGARLRHTPGSTCPHGCRACVPRLRHHALITPCRPLGRYAAAVERAGPSRRLEDDAVAMGEMVVPACPAGGLLLWDFRTLHRGMPNDTRRGITHAPRNKCRTLLVARCPLSAPPALVLRSAARCACGAVDRLGARPPRCDAGEPHQRARRAACRGGGARRSACIDREAAG